MHRESIETLTAELQAELTEQAVAGKLVPFDQKQLVADAPAKFVLRDELDRAGGFVLCSSPKAPELVARGAERAQAARAILGPQLGQAVLAPIASGRIDGLSFAVLPYCRPLSSNRILRQFQRRRLRP